MEGFTLGNSNKKQPLLASFVLKVAIYAFTRKKDLYSQQRKTLKIKQE